MRIKQNILVKIFKPLFVMGVFLFVASSGLCEMITLKSGKFYEGNIVEDRKHYVMFRIKETGKVEAFLKENILSVEESVSEEISPEGEAPQVQAGTVTPKKRPPKMSVDSDDNLLRIYGEEILDENAPTDQYDFSEDPTFYVRTQKDSPEVMVERMIGQWIKSNSDSPYFLTGFVAAIFLLYIFFCFPLYLIAKKTHTEHPNLAWFPIANIILLCHVADRPWWWIILLMIPLVNIIIIAILWMEATDACGKPKWLGLLILVPVVTIIFQWYLALCKTGEEAPAKKKKVAMIDEEKTAEEEENALYNQIVPTQSTKKPKRF